MADLSAQIEEQGVIPREESAERGIESKPRAKVGYSMKTSLDHLPEGKRAQLQAIVAAARSKIRTIDMIILFGSYARGDWVEDDETGYWSDYDLLMVVEQPSLAKDAASWRRVSDELLLIAGHIPVTLIPIDIRELNTTLRAGQYFYTEVIKDGILLFDSTRMKLAAPKLQTVEERLKGAHAQFCDWFESASYFWRGAGYYMALNRGCHAAFSLHQATERYYQAVMLVYTSYKPKSHSIEQLGSQTVGLHEALDWPLRRKETRSNEHLYRLLKRAYIEARYNKHYRITHEELVALRQHILDLAERVRRACGDKLKLFALEAGVEVPGELPPLPTEADTIELPELPSLEDRPAVEAWCESVVQRSQERGEMLGVQRGHKEGREEGLREGVQQGREEGREEGLREGVQQGREEGRHEGREEGLREGEERGREEGLREGVQQGREEGRLQERANAILDVLQRRGLTLTDAQRERITTCRDEATLAKWWDLAWTATTSERLFDEN